MLISWSALRIGLSTRFYRLRLYVPAAHILYGLGFFPHTGHLLPNGLHLRREFPIPGFILHQFIFAPLRFTIEFAGSLLFLSEKALEIQAARLSASYFSAITHPPNNSPPQMMVMIR